MNAKKRPVTEYEIVDHGIKHEQYFAGCGVAFTPYDDVATGIGDDAQEALDDAIESLAMSGWDVETIEGEFPLIGSDSVAMLAASSSETHEDYDSHHYYVSVRVRGGE